jgi:hypothetical protein
VACGRCDPAGRYHLAKLIGADRWAANDHIPILLLLRDELDGKIAI